jgi:hypothetical protein
MKHIFIGLLISMTIQTNAQSSKNIESSNIEIVQAFLRGFNEPSFIQESLSLLSEDYKFSNPILTLHSKAEFIKLATEIGSVVTGLKVTNIADNHSWVAVSYEFYTSIAGIEINYATEWFRLEDGMIQESQLIYDATKWRAHYAQLEK